MMPVDPENYAWWKMFLYAIFASMGGFIGHILRTFDARVKIQWLRASLEGISAGFVGILFLLMCQATDLSEQWTGVIVGVAGWLGANASIKVLEKLVYAKLGIKAAEPVRERAYDQQTEDDLHK